MSTPIFIHTMRTIHQSYLAEFRECPTCRRTKHDDEFAADHRECHVCTNAKRRANYKRAA